MKLAITMGDINGIGPEVILKSLESSAILKSCTPIIYGSGKVLAYHKNIVKDCNLNFVSISSPEHAQKGKVNVINCWDDNITISLGKATEEGGKYAALALEKAVEDVRAGLVDGLVTAPVNKYALKLANFGFTGHTEFLAARDNSKDALMTMVSDYLVVATVTNHLPVSEVAAKLSKELVLAKITTLHKTLSENFGKDKPVIAVLGLNPHAGDEGALGNEDEQIIRPAIIEAKKNGIMVAGPYPADAYFGSGKWSKVDATLAMYHDQGLIPFKTISFGEGTNYTAGLSFVRTSPDHGTAFDIAGNNQADPSSMTASIYKAIELIRFKKEFLEDRANPLVRQKKQSAGIND